MRSSIKKKKQEQEDFLGKSQRKQQIINYLLCGEQVNPKTKLKEMVSVRVVKRTQNSCASKECINKKKNGEINK